MRATLPGKSPACLAPSGKLLWGRAGSVPTEVPSQNALAKSTCMQHPRCDTRARQQHRAVLAHCCLSDKPAEATSLYQQLQEHCCLFLQHSPHKQQDFYCPISSSSYYLKNDSLGEEKAAWVIIYVKNIAGICSGWNIQSHPFSQIKCCSFHARVNH